MIARGTIIDIPAFERIHQLARRVETFAHQGRLLTHGNESIFEQTSLVLGGSWRGHLV
jgi:hypothetical protein